MQVKQYILKSKNDNAEIERWASIPHSFQCPNGDVVVCAVDGWENEKYQIESEVLTIQGPANPVEQVISRRQFFQQLANQSVITREEALAAAGSGAIPSAIQGLIDALPQDQQFSAKMIIVGAIQFERTHPLTSAIGIAYGFSSDKIDEFFNMAAAL